MTDKIIHNSYSAAQRAPFGAVPCATQVRLAITVKEAGVTGVYARLWINGGESVVPMQAKKNEYEAVIEAPDHPCVVWYYFIIDRNGDRVYYGNNQRQTGGVGEIYKYEPPSFQITVYKQNHSIPRWVQGAVFYQIMTDRFFNGNESGEINKKPITHDDIIIHKSTREPISMNTDENGVLLKNDFYGGNFKGIIKKLEYLKQLGVTAIYLMPVFEAFSNHKYDTADYMNVDQMFGTQQDFRELCESAKANGMHVIIDGVFSHTGNDSRYFNKYGRYPDLGAYQSKDSPYYDWYTFTQHPDDYECWWGCRNLPNVKETSPSYVQLIKNVIEKWQDMGVDGWRLDVADELPMEFLREIRGTVKGNNPNAAVIGEVWEDATRKVTYGELRNYFEGDTLDGVMNYPFRDAVMKFSKDDSRAQDTVGDIMTICENYPPDCLNASLNVLTTHDTVRLVTDTKYTWQAVIALTLQFSLPGAPCVFYGEEVGMTGGPDPLNRAPHPWKTVTKDTKKAYDELLALRRQCEELQSGDCEVGNVRDDALWIKRRIGGRCVVTIVNRHRRNSPNVKVPLDTDQNSVAQKLFDYRGATPEITYKNELAIKMPPRSCVIIQISPES